MASDSVPVGSVDAAPTPAASAPTGPSPREARAAKVAAFREGAAKAEPAAPAVTAAPVEAPAKVEPVADDPPDPKTAKGIEAIEKRDKRAREALAADQAKWKAERDLEVAELARLRADLTGKAPKFDDLKKLPPAKRALEAMKLVGLDPDDEEAMEVIARDAYARSKSGKADPKNKAYADQVSEKSALAAEIAAMKAELDSVKGEFKTRDQRAAMEQFQNQYLDQAVKAVPADPSFIGLALTANPTKARAALLQIGQRLESENGDTPTHAEVIAEYERSKRAELADMGVPEAQIAAMLAKPAPVVVKAAPPKTLDVTVRSTTPPLNGNPTRDQKIAAARSGLKKLGAETLS